MLSAPQDITILNLTQLTRGKDWRLKLLHDRPYHLLLWITRGQGLMILDGVRRGVGAHNAVFLPAGALFALDAGRQSVAQALILPAATGLRLPEIPRHLRIREVQVQSELTGLIEAASREENNRRPLSGEALEGHAALISVWLRRQIMLEEHMPRRRNAAERLSAAFCARLASTFRSGGTMADHAEALGVTPTHLSRAVKAATGKTAADLMTERVLHEARSLLSETDEPAQRIAAYRGIGSPAYFSRFMQQHTGRSPSKLRSDRPQSPSSQVGYEEPVSLFAKFDVAKQSPTGGRGH